MSLKAQVTGMIAEPVLRYTGKQQAVLELRINATASARDGETGRWNELGDPLWVSAQFWEARAESLAQHLQKGARVTVEGTLVVESYQRRDGGTGVAYKLHRPQFLGVIPPQRGSSEGARSGFGGADPSAASAGHTGFSRDSEAPF